MTQHLCVIIMLNMKVLLPFESFLNRYLICRHQLNIILQQVQVASKEIMCVLEFFNFKIDTVTYCTMFSVQIVLDFND